MAILPLFTQHSRSWQQNLYVYPVISRRSRGLSIGINVNPDTACNFDCVYCCVDRTRPPAVRKVDLDRVSAELDHLLSLATSGELFSQPPFDTTPANLRRLNDIAFSGDGEPTAYPRLLEACRIAADALVRHGHAESKIVLITNATLFDRPAVRQTLDFLDAHHGEIWAKIDAGTEPYYRLIERTTIPLQRVLDNILLAGRQRSIVIQSLFLELDGQGPPAGEIPAYIERLKWLIDAGCRISRVQVYTVARTPAVSSCQPLAPASLDDISEQVRAATGLTVETFYGPQ